jgi:hypothetical protein
MERKNQAKTKMDAPITPARRLDLMKAIVLSAKALGDRHPAVIALQAASSSPTFLPKERNANPRKTSRVPALAAN